MKCRSWAFVGLLCAVPVISADVGALQADYGYATLNPNRVRNGSFANSQNTWVDTNCHYMSLLAGSTAIPRWTVTPDTVNEIVWAMTPTCDGYRAAAGQLFVDLTGFGGDSPNGGVQQALKTTVVGQQYVFSVAVVGTPPLVTVDGVPIGLTPGTPFKKGSTIWTPENGIFVAQSVHPVLKLQNPQPGAQIVFIDKVTVRAL
jgi:hypothetical protein